MSYKKQAYILRASRQEKGLTQSDIAERLGVTVQYIANIERGVCGIPPKYVKLIAKMTKTSISEFRNAFLSDEEERWASKLKG